MTTESLTWTHRASGTVTTWPIGKVAGVTGLGMPPVQHVSRNQVSNHGAAPVSTRFTKRRITIPFIIYGTEAVTRQALRDWADLLNTTREDGQQYFWMNGWLTVNSLLGDSRRIAATYAGGLELVQDFETYIEATIAFDCFDPLFEDTTPTSIPMSTTTTIVGDAPAWPIWGLTRNDHAAMSTLQWLKGPLVTIAGPEAGFWDYKMTWDGGLDSGFKSMVCDSRPEQRGLWVSTTYYADPVADYLADDHHSDFVEANDLAHPNARWFEVPFDRYGYTPGTAYLTPGGDGTTGDFDYTCKYFARWLTA